jgi:hypothetical protein
VKDTSLNQEKSSMTKITDEPNYNQSDIVNTKLKKCDESTTLSVAGGQECNFVKASSVTDSYECNNPKRTVVMNRQDSCNLKMPSITDNLESHPPNVIDNVEYNNKKLTSITDNVECCTTQSTSVTSVTSVCSNSNDLSNARSDSSPLGLPDEPEVIWIEDDDDDDGNDDVAEEDDYYIDITDRIQNRKRQCRQGVSYAELSASEESSDDGRGNVKSKKKKFDKSESCPTMKADQDLKSKSSKTRKRMKIGK